MDQCLPPGFDSEKHKFETGHGNQIAMMAKFAERDQDLVVMRRFERLRVYELVMLQHDLVGMTKELDRQLKRGDNVAARKIVEDASPVLKAHAEAIAAYEQLRNLPKTSQNIIDTLKKSSGRNEQLEREYSTGWTELISLGSTPKGGVHQMWERCQPIVNLFVPKSEYEAVNQDDIVRYSEANMRTLEYVVITFLFIAALVGPCAIMLTNDPTKKFSIMGASMCCMLALGHCLSDQTQRNRCTIIMSYAAFLVALSSNDNFAKRLGQ